MVEIEAMKFISVNLLGAHIISFLFYGCKGNNISGSVFHCPMISNGNDRVPTSVHELRPSDIKLVGVLGDSFSSGFGASPGGGMVNGSEFISRDNKGLAWSGG